MEERKKIIDEINESFGNYLDDGKHQDIAILIESLAICFQEVVNELVSLRDAIESDQNTVNPVYRRI